MPHIDLLELPYFQGISLDAVVSLVDLMEPRDFQAGDIIALEGSGAPPPLYIATQGTVQLSKHDMHGHERPLAELHAPTLFGEIELFCQIPPVATTRALTRVSSFFLTRTTYDTLFHAKHPAVTSFTYNVARVACHRLAIADTMLAQLLDEENLVNLRQTVFAQMHHDDWSKVTGAFPRPMVTRR